MENLNYYLEKAKESEYALGHFNFASAEQLRAIVLAFTKVHEEAKANGKDIALMVGTSEGEADFIGYRQARKLVDSWVEETGLPIFLNTDHHKDYDLIKKAIDIGYDSILIDGSKLEFDQNVEITKKVIEYINQINPDGTVEGELGYLRGSSEVQDKIEISSADFTKPEEAKEFVEETGVDRLAVAIGNIHGITTGQEMKLDIELLKKISDLVPETFIVLHGGSGLSDEDFKNAIMAGVTNIHINTEVRIAYREGIEEAFKTDTHTPYKFLGLALDKMEMVIERRLRLFSGL